MVTVAVSIMVNVMVSVTTTVLVSAMVSVVSTLLTHLSQYNLKDQCRLDIKKYALSQRTINEWNKLTMNCVTASSVNIFKNKVDTYLRRVGYM